MPGIALLRPLSAVEVGPYLENRLRVAGTGRVRLAPGVDLEVHIGSDGETGWLLAEQQDGQERYREGHAADEDELLRLLGRVVKAAP